MNIVDISRPLLTTIEYPGDPETRLDAVQRIENGDICNLSAVYACVHTATHVDAPYHFLEGGETIEEAREVADNCEAIVKIVKQKYMDTHEVIIDREVENVMNSVLINVLKCAFKKEIGD